MVRVWCGWWAQQVQTGPTKDEAHNKEQTGMENKSVIQSSIKSGKSGSKGNPLICIPKCSSETIGWNQLVRICVEPTVEMLFWKYLWRSTVEMTCWDRLFKLSVEIDCWDYLLRSIVKISCWDIRPTVKDYLFRSTVEITCWDQLLRSSAEVCNLGYLLLSIFRISVEFICWDQLLRCSAQSRKLSA